MLYSCHSVVFELFIRVNVFLFLKNIAKLGDCVYNSLRSGRGAVRLARLHGVQEVGGSNPLAPTINKKTVCKGGFFLEAPPIKGTTKSSRPDHKQKNRL